MPSAGDLRAGKPQTRETIAVALALPAELAAAALERWRWPSGEPSCPHCGGITFYRTNALKAAGCQRYRCKACGRDYTAFSGTPLTYAKLPARFYVAAIYAASDDTLSSRQFAALSGVNPRTAHYLLQKLRSLQ